MQFVIDMLDIIKTDLDDIFGQNCSLKLANLRPNMSYRLPHILDILAQPYIQYSLCTYVRVISPDNDDESHKYNEMSLGRHVVTLLKRSSLAID